MGVAPVDAGVLLAQLKQRQLWGGAVLAALPASFADMSQVRDVPDSQEVWADASSDASVIAELVERADVPDEGSAAYFWADAACLNDCGDAVCDCSQPVDLQELPHLAAAAASLAWGVQAPGAPQPGRAALPPAYVCLACVRLPRVKTDVLLTLHVPRSSSPEAGEAAKALLLGILRSLRVVDWGLFGEPLGDEV